MEKYQWKEVNLGDISMMRFGKKPKESEGLPKGHPFFSGDKVEASDKDHIHDDPELVIIARGISLGDVKISPPRSFITDTSIVVKLNEKIADKKFYYYYLQRRDLQNLSSGVNKPRITITNLKKYKVKNPPLSEQKKIGSILYTLDKKIEKNIKMCKSLKRMSQAIFKHWFIDFEFPDEGDDPYKTKGGQTIKTTWGLIPEGWYTGKYTDLVEVINGKTPNKTATEHRDGSLPLFTPEDVQRIPYVTNTKKYIKNGDLYPRNTVFVTSRGKININAIPMVASESCYAVLGREHVGQYFVYLLTKSCFKDLTKASYSTVINTIDKETFESKNILIPPKALIKKFENTVRPLFNKMMQLSITNNALSKLRDGLIPKLVSGEMRVV